MLYLTYELTQGFQYHVNVSMLASYDCPEEWRGGFVILVRGSEYLIFCQGFVGVLPKKRNGILFDRNDNRHLLELNYDA